MTIKKSAIFLPMLAGAWALAGCMTTETGPDARRGRDNPITAGPVAGRCYPGGCTWFDIRSFDLVRETERAALLRIDVREGGSNHAMSADAPRSSRGVRIEWGEYGEAWLFCSRDLPAMITQGANGTYDVQRIDIIDGGLPQEVMITQYNHVCHTAEELRGDGAAARLGYRPMPEGVQMEFTVRSPEALFEEVER